MFAPARAVYVHVPFCRRRCGYCNFTVVAGPRRPAPGLSAGVGAGDPGAAAPLPVDTLYIGGGTPTELSPPELAQLCDLLRSAFPPRSGYEWSIEANPLGLDRTKLEILCAAGVNRISLGVQSFHPRKLQLLERDHRAEDVTSIFPHVRRQFPVGLARHDLRRPGRVPRRVASGSAIRPGAGTGPSLDLRPDV